MTPEEREEAEARLRDQAGFALGATGFAFIVCAGVLFSVVHAALGWALP